MIIILHIRWNDHINDKVCLFEDHSKASTLPCDHMIRKKCEFNCNFVSLFMTTLKISETYKLLVTKYLIEKLQVESSSRVKLKIIMYPSKHIIDSKWNDIINQLCYERRELCTAMAWLSTLGGAFSALGDSSTDCALMAGRISIQQFRIALKLGDPPTVARCRLFYALSLIQCGKLKQARNLIRKMYFIAITQHGSDVRLQRMCLGIWNKLQYDWSKKFKHKYLYSLDQCAFLSEIV